MPISVKCPACGQGHKAPERAAGKTLSCMACGASLTVPVEDDLPPTPYALAEVDSPPEPPPPPKPKKSPRPKPDLATLPPLTTDDPPLWRRHLHWLLALAMIPLAATLLMRREERDIFVRLTETLHEASPEQQERFERVLKSDVSLDDVLGSLPDGKLHGAWLSRSSKAHWLMAAISTTLFLVFFMFLASDGSARPGQVLVVGLFTATVGIGLLLLVQGIASITEGRLLIGRSILVIVFYIFKFIAFSYAAASDPDNGFMLSFFGFTFGVGLAEELIKGMPLFRYHDDSEGKAWRGLFIWGLASGAGFGIAEGILYSGRYYNGITGSSIYLVRFLSCVALHAIWSGSIAITLYLRRDSFGQAGEWYEWIGPIFMVVGIPMVLHGLYDTSLKRDMNGLALFIAVLSFGWLAFLSSRLYQTDDEAAKRAMLKEYQRRRRAVE